MMGGYRLPVNVPETNVASTVLDDMASRQERPDGSPALQVVQEPAARKGLKIKVRTSWDGGLVGCGCNALYKGSSNTQCWLDMFCHLTYCLMHAVNQVMCRIVNNIISFSIEPVCEPCVKRVECVCLVLHQPEQQ